MSDTLFMMSMLLCFKYFMWPGTSKLNRNRAMPNPLDTAYPPVQDIIDWSCVQIGIRVLLCGNVSVVSPTVVSLLAFHIGPKGAMVSCGNCALSNPSIAIWSNVSQVSLPGGACASRINPATINPQVEYLYCCKDGCSIVQYSSMSALKTGKMMSSEQNRAETVLLPQNGWHDRRFQQHQTKRC